MSQNTVSQKAKLELLKNTREYKKTLLLKRIFWVSVIGVALSFLQYYQLLPAGILPKQIMPLINLWASVGSLILLLLSLFCYATKRQLMLDVMALNNFELGHPMPEQATFDKHIDPNSTISSNGLTPEEQNLLSEISKDSLIFMVISMVAVYVQIKIGAYHEMQAYFSWLINFIN